MGLAVGSWCRIFHACGLIGRFSSAGFGLNEEWGNYGLAGGYGGDVFGLKMENIVVLMSLAEMEKMGLWIGDGWAIVMFSS